MKIIHNSPSGALDVPLLGRAGIEPGEIVETTADKGRQLIEQQPYHQWSEVSPRPRRRTSTRDASPAADDDGTKDGE